MNTGPPSPTASYTNHICQCICCIRQQGHPNGMPLYKYWDGSSDVMNDGDDTLAGLELEPE